MFNEALAGRHGGNHNPTGVNQHTAGLREDKSNKVTLDQPEAFKPLRGNSKGYTSRRLLKKRPERLGELLKHMPKAKASSGNQYTGPAPKKNRSIPDPLSSYGISKKLSSKCQKLAVLTLL